MLRWHNNHTVSHILIEMQLKRPHHWFFHLYDPNLLMMPERKMPYSVSIEKHLMISTIYLTIQYSKSFSAQSYIKTDQLCITNVSERLRRKSSAKRCLKCSSECSMIVDEPYSSRETSKHPACRPRKHVSQTVFLSDRQRQIRWMTTTVDYVGSHWCEM